MSVPKRPGARATRFARRSYLVPLDEPTVANLYGRVSTKEQRDEGVSLPAQSTAGRSYIASQAAHGWLFGDEYLDTESGRKVSRANYDRLLSDIRRQILDGNRVVLVVTRLDRLGRNIRERVRVWDEMKELGVPIYSIREGGLVPEMVYNMLAAVAQEESRLISERVSDSIAYFETALWRPVGRAPWGYTWRGATPEERADRSPNSVLVRDPDEAPHVRQAWAMRAAGASFRAVTRYVASLPSEARGGRNLTFGTLRRMFAAPVYVGRPGPFDDDAEVVLARPMAKWDALIDDATYRAAAEQERLGRQLPPQASGEYALTGLLWCPRCHHRMQGRRKSHTDAGRKRPEYSCSGWSKGAETPGCASAYTVPASKIEPLVLGIVREMLRVAGEQAALAPEIEQVWRERTGAAVADTIGGEIKALEMRRALSNKELAAVSRARVADTIDEAGYAAARAEIAAEVEAIEAELSRQALLPRPLVLPPLQATLAAARGWGRAWDRVGAERPRAVRAALAGLVARIEPHRVGRGQYEVAIQWTPAGMSLLQAAQALGTLEMVGVDAFGQTKASTPTFPCTP